MSRSKRKPYVWSFGGGKARWQKLWMSQKHRLNRRNVKQLLHRTEDYDNLILPIPDEYAETWSSPRDSGKAHYWPEGSPRICRK
jgi:hypothetical protein